MLMAVHDDIFNNCSGKLVYLHTSPKIGNKRHRQVTHGVLLLLFIQYLTIFRRHNDQPVFTNNIITLDLCRYHLNVILAYIIEIHEILIMHIHYSLPYASAGV